ncbi:MAG: type II toxin-antitoxin system VapC family toxin [Deltaproteobacteria bacterium]|nr:type II toxin-antitoxin system VapC family toxin [Deltaproteobacteria bacterium]MBI3078194.1 type II toxin-antitoxin system VapC family toxin [Deltaproteobacteria bacterium]
MADAPEARPTLPGRVFCDTSYFYACADRDDMHHRRALALASEAASRRTQLWTTWDVISETLTLLRYRHSSLAAIRFLDEVKPGLHIVDYGANVRVEAEQVFRRRSRDHRLSFCDAISFIVVITLLDHMPCLAFDEDFRSLGLTVVA